MAKPATIKDVALLAGVSTATVSRVLNRSARVEQSVLEKVEAAVEQLKYRRNLVARGLRTQRTDIVSLICSDIENPFFTAICRGIEDFASKLGLSVVICNTDGDFAKEREYIEMLSSQSVSGVIISPASSAETDVSKLVRQGVAVVAVDRRLRHKTDSVFVDNKLGAFQATDHLIKAGAKRVACITGPRNVMTAQHRLAGYKAALTANGMRAQESLIRFADFKDAGGAKAVHELLHGAKKPDGIFVANNRMTTGALLALRELGVVVPDEISLVGFDDLPWAELVSPTISTVRQPSYELGRAAAKLLTERMQGVAGASPREIILEPELIIRASSCKPGFGPKSPPASA
jgi:LacI family transcriptional regulator